MLINFRFSNSRSFYEEANLSLLATKDTELKELNTFEVDSNLMPKDDNVLLKSAVIFGSNASGKTNVLKVLSYMRNVVLYSSSIDIVDSNETFAFVDSSDYTNSLYEVEFIQNNIYYKYGFIINNKIIKEEWLFKRKERLTNIFKRIDNNLEIASVNKNITNIINLSSKITFLSLGCNFNLDITNNLRDVMNWFSNLLIVFENNANSLDIYSGEGQKYKKQAIEILKTADIGVVDLNVVKNKIADISDINDIMKFNTQIQTQPKQLGQIKQEANNIYNLDIKTTYNLYNYNEEIVGHKDILLFKDSDFNSEGTKRLLLYLGWILAAIDKSRVILIDEIDSKLHFLVADYLLKIFNSIDKNNKNAQLICTAHNIMLMDEDLRRDQIYFTSKNKIGKSSLVSLSDFKNVRKNDLFSKKYLAGFYTKIPNMKDM